MRSCPHCGADLLALSGAGIFPRLVSCRKCLNVVLIEDDDPATSVKTINGTETVAEMAPAGSVIAGVFSILGEVLDELPVLPEIPQRIVALVHDPLTSMEDLAEVINEDAGIALKVLRMSNSAFYAGPNEITDLRTACSRMGMKVLVNIAHAESNGQFYRTSDPRLREFMHALWRHGVATAHCVDQLSLMLPGVNTELAFMAGLTHDIGKLILLDTLLRRYRGNIGRLKEDPNLLRKVLDRFYPIVGIQVAQHWRMTPEYLCTTFFNSRPQLVPVEEWKPLTHAVSLASDIAGALGYDVVAPDADVVPDFSDHPSGVLLGITNEAMADLLVRLEQSLESFMQVLTPP